MDDIIAMCVAMQDTCELIETLRNCREQCKSGLNDDDFAAHINHLSQHMDQYAFNITLMTSDVINQLREEE